MAIHHLTPLDDAAVLQLQAGDEVYLSGVIYMARDAAHKRFVDTLSAGQALPVDLRGQVVFYGGPGPAKPGQAIGVVAP
ncbi:MAG: fumarate hydratase C-terminal domain-containing protein, partial [Comamonas sp.]|nr:fumarate hydratase C-terminal domain-containing protein [Comamonas sp.]